MPQIRNEFNEHLHIWCPSYCVALAQVYITATHYTVLFHFTDTFSKEAYWCVDDEQVAGNMKTTTPTLLNKYLKVSRVLLIVLSWSHCQVSLAAGKELLIFTTSLYLLKTPQRSICPRTHSVRILKILCMCYVRLCILLSILMKILNKAVNNAPVETLYWIFWSLEKS